MIASGHRVGVAVSGGADSICLLHVLWRMSTERTLRLHVLHVDHQLRGAESRADAEFVERFAKSLDLPCSIRIVDLASTTDNLEQAARDARRAYFREARAELGLDSVALGHTRSDQAETVLFRFLRGSGLAGLGAMRPRTPEGLVRPLLERTRAEIVEYLRSEGLDWREDATNESPDFARNRIRRFLMPQLMADWNPNLPETLWHAASLAQAEEDYWERVIGDLASRMVKRQGSYALLAVSELRGLELAVARRLIRWAYAAVRGDLRQIEFAHVEAALQLASQPEGDGRFQAPGLDVFRSFDWIRIGPPPGSGMNRFFEIEVDGPGSYTLPDGARILLETEALQGYTGSGILIDRAKCPGPLLLRSWRPGDQFEGPGRSRKKLKLLFQEARVPLWERRFWPILTYGDEIVWSRRFGVAEQYAVSPETVQIWRLQEQLLGGS